MPGEMLQIVTQGEVKATVHRVVAAAEGETRLSAPVLLRARISEGSKMDIARYFIDKVKDPTRERIGGLLRECDGMAMLDIHQALQPSSS